MEEKDEQTAGDKVNTDGAAPAHDGSANRLKNFSFWVKTACVFYVFAVAAALTLAARMDIAEKKAKAADDDGVKVSSIKDFVGSNVKDSVGIVKLYGAISQSSSAYGWDQRGSGQIAARIRKMAQRKEIKAVVLDINSPGGTVGAVQEIYSAIMRAKAESKKPIIAHFGDISASGGYYVGSACDSIYALPGTITGSIGVIFSGGNMEGLMKKIGYKAEIVKSGKFKDIGSSMRDMTAEERQLLQDMIDDSYDQFVTAVADGRKIPADRVRQLADGRIFTGRQALKAGLVDKLGDLQDAVDAAGQLAGLGKDPKVTYGAGEPLDNVLSLMSSKFGGGGILSETLDLTPRLEYRLYMR